MTAEGKVSRLPAMSDDPFNAVLVEREDINPELAIFRYAYENDAVPDFEPGQFTTLGLIKPDDPNKPPKRPRKGPALLRRAYSIASSPNEKRWIEFFIVRVEGGALTPRLWDMKLGDRIFMDSKIKGHFTLDGVPDGKDLVMISTGTGLAPCLSMLHTFRNSGRWRRLVIMHGVRLSQDLGYRAELEKIAAKDESVVYIPTVTREPDGSDYDGFRGRVTGVIDPSTYEQLVGSPLTPEDSHVFLCGNPAMIDQCETELCERGWSVKGRDNPQGNIHFERYW